MFKNLVKKFRKLDASYKVSMVVLGAILLWFFIGIFTRPEYDSELISSKKDFLQKVSITEIFSKQNPRTIRLYGNIESEKVIDIKPQTSGKISEIIAKEGTNLKEGDEILQIEMDDRESRLVKAKSNVNNKQIKYNAAKQLARKGYGSSSGLAEAEAELQNSRSELEQIELDIKNTEIKAPFDGFIDKVFVDKGDVVSANSTSIARYIDDNSFMAIGYISQKDVSYINIGSNALVKIKTNGDYAEVNGVVTFISKIAEEETKTFRVEVKLNTSNPKIRHGETAEIEIYGKKINSFFIPSSAITLDGTGNIGIKIVNSDDIVMFYETEIISELKNGMIVRVLDNNFKQDKFNLIVIGQNFVVNGDKVKVKMTGNELN